MLVQIEVSIGELIDKIIILQIKIEKIQDYEKQINLKYEFELLNAHLNQILGIKIGFVDWFKTTSIEQTLLNYPTTAFPFLLKYKPLYDSLNTTNQTIWKIEDDIRKCESDKIFDKRFIELARSVYHNNDNRAKLKKELNQLFGSSIVEEKLYTEY